MRSTKNVRDAGACTGGRGPPPRGCAFAVRFEARPLRAHRELSREGKRTHGAHHAHPSYANDLTIVASNLALLVASTAAKDYLSAGNTERERGVMPPSRSRRSR